MTFGSDGLLDGTEPADPSALNKKRRESCRFCLRGKKSLSKIYLNFIRFTQKVSGAPCELLIIESNVSVAEGARFHVIQYVFM